MEAPAAPFGALTDELPMAFGLFGKKPPEKMQAKPAVKPRAPNEAPTRPPLAAFGAPSRPPEAVPKPAPAPPPPAELEDDLESLDFTGIQLAEETDPLQAAIEEAAIAYANEHEDEALAILTEWARASDRSAEAERVWLMLFDLCQVTGNRSVFAELELEYAERFEKQPPTWKESATAAAVTAATGAATGFKGELRGDNDAGFAHALQTLEKSTTLRLDLAKVKEVDADGCQRLLDLLARARKIKRPIELLGLDTLARLLEPKIAAADDNQVVWCLYLEVLQRQAKQEQFDEIALTFAIKFEISPPAYEPPPPVTKVPKPTLKPPPARTDDAFYLEGQVVGGRIDGLDAWLSDRETAVIDMSGVLRIDFVSAGALLNIISPHWQRGMSMTLRHPNRLVAELLGVVGMGQMATIVFAKK